MKYKIMHITQSNGGVFKYLEMLLKNMSNENFEHILVCASDYRDEIHIFNNLVSDVYLVDMTREISLISDFKSIIQIHGLIGKYQPDIIYAHSSKAGALSRVSNLFYRKKIIYNPHGWAFNMKSSQLKRNLYKIIEKVLAFICDKIIVISDYEKLSALENNLISEKKIITIANGIDVKKYDETFYLNSVMRSNYGIDDDAYVIGMVGRISKQKAPDSFVKVAKEIKKIIPNSYFIIVGDGEDRMEIESMIKYYNLDDSFLITGWVDNTYNFISLFDTAVLLSRWEGFGLALSEYMICRKPVVASNVDAIPSIVVNGETGFLIEVDNITEAVDAIKKIYYMDSELDIILDKAESKVRNEFNITRVCSEHENLFYKLILDK